MKKIQNIIKWMQEIGLCASILRAFLLLFLVVALSACKKNSEDTPTEYPQLYSLTSATAVAGSQITLQGVGFGSDPTAVTAQVGDSSAKVVSVAGSQLVIQLPKLITGSTYPVKITIKGQVLSLATGVTIVPLRLISYSINRPLQGALPALSTNYYYYYDTVGRLSYFIRSDYTPGSSSSASNQLTRLVYASPSSTQVNEVQVGGPNGDRYVYSYTSALITRMDHYILGSASPLEYQLFSYDGQQRLSRIVTYSVDPPLKKGSEVFTYNADGNILFDDLLNAVDALTFRTKYSTFGTANPFYYGAFSSQPGLFVGAANLSVATGGYPAPVSPNLPLNLEYRGSIINYTYQLNSCSLPAVATSVLETSTSSALAGVGTATYLFAGCQ